MNTSAGTKIVPEVETLRRAAGLIRHRAEVANTDDARRPYGDRDVAPVRPAQWSGLVDNYLGGAIGAHCAAWRPVAALAVADALDTFANEYETDETDVACPQCEDGRCDCLGTVITICAMCTERPGDCSCMAPMLAIARAYLAEEEPPVHRDAAADARDVRLRPGWLQAQVRKSVASLDQLPAKLRKSIDQHRPGRRSS